MWIPTAMIAAAAGAGLMAAVMAYLAAVERDNLVWRLWSISFALDAARTLVLAFASPHGTVTDVAAEMLSAGHVGLLAIGILLWAEIRRPLRPVAIGTGAAVIWAGVCAALDVPEIAIHGPLDLFFGAVLGLSAWALWTQAITGERALRRAMAVIVVVWAVQELASVTVGWHGRVDPIGFTAIHGYGTSLALLLIVAALRRRHLEAVRATAEAERARAVADHANRRLTDFARTSSDWFWEQDAELRFTYLSQSVWEHSTLSPEDHYGKTRRETGPLGVGDD